ncbi:hypothetical protein AB7W40_20375 [Providencia rettgeri]
MKRLLIALCGLGALSLGVAANDYKAGSEFANSLKNTGTDTIKNTNPADIIPNYTANPSESGYYGGVFCTTKLGHFSEGVFIRHRR